MNFTFDFLPVMIFKGSWEPQCPGAPMSGSPGAPGAPEPREPREPQTMNCNFALSAAPVRLCLSFWNEENLHLQLTLRKYTLTTYTKGKVQKKKHKKN